MVRIVSRGSHAQSLGFCFSGSSSLSGKGWPICMYMYLHNIHCRSCRDSVVKIFMEKEQFTVYMHLLISRIAVKSFHK